MVFDSYPMRFMARAQPVLGPCALSRMTILLALHLIYQALRVKHSLFGGVINEAFIIRSHFVVFDAHLGAGAAAKTNSNTEVS